MYQLLLYVHVICAVIWVGGAVTIQAQAIMVRRSDDPAELASFARRSEQIGSRVFVPAAVVLLVAGAAMVYQAWSFTQPWVVAAIALFVLSAAGGGLYMGPRAKRAAQLFDSEGPSSVEARHLAQRLFLVSRLELVSFAVVLALMVFKPGA